MAVRKMILVDPMQHQQQQGWQEMSNRLDREMIEILHGKSTKDLPEDEKAKHYLLALRRFINAKQQQEQMEPVPVRIISESAKEEETNEQQQPVVRQSRDVQVSPIKQQSAEQQTTPKQIMQKHLTQLRPQTPPAERANKPRETSQGNYSIDKIVESVGDEKQKARYLLTTLEKEGGDVQWDPGTGRLLLKGKPVPDTNIEEITKHVLLGRQAPPIGPPGSEHVVSVIRRAQDRRKAVLEKTQSGSGLKWCKY